MKNKPIPEIKYKREVKSYVQRSRMTLRQRTGLAQFWPKYVVETNDQVLGFSNIFQRDASTILEIGFGMGTSLLHMAEKNPELNFLGIEVHRPGIGSLVMALEERNITNVRLINGDASVILKNSIADHSLLGTLIFFPDPWPKRRHHKRRLVQMPLIDLVYQKLQPNGYFHLATDVEDYAQHMLFNIQKHTGFTIIEDNLPPAGDLVRPKTKFERRGERLGHQITDLIYLKNDTMEGKQCIEG